MPKSSKTTRESATSTVVDDASRARGRVERTTIDATRDWRESRRDARHCVRRGARERTLGASYTVRFKHL